MGRKAARVLPVPVGALMSRCGLLARADQARRCTGVGQPSRSWNQRARNAGRADRGPFAEVGERVFMAVL